MIECFKSFSQTDLLNYLNIHYSHLVGLNRESDWPVTGYAFDSLNSTEVELIEQAVGEILGERSLRELLDWKSKSLPHYRREVLRLGCNLLPDMLYEKTGIKSANPPLEIQSMMRQEMFAGDLYSGDMCMSALSRAQQIVFRSGNYLDFGCSSGALTRNMWARFPDAHWYGCDPVASAISWASEQFPDIDFKAQEQTPPLPFENSYFDGVYAISIWSHFSEEAAMKWFAEMRRIIKSGGFLMFTTHGIRSLYFYLEHNHKTVNAVAPLLAELTCSQFSFEQVWRNRSEAEGLETRDWGNAYLLIGWIAQKLYHDWRVLDYQPGLNQLNQDVYVIQRM
jgi:SAM-dependent methyltransferase